MYTDLRWGVGCTGDRDISVRNVDQLPTVCTPTGIEPITQAYALTRN